MSTLANHSLFLQSDGTVKSCGANESGQCGTGKAKKKHEEAKRLYNFLAKLPSMKI